MILLKRFVACLPNIWQSELKRIYFARQIRKDKFVTSEPEYEILSQFISPGDWVIDVGANVGHYTKRFSDLVGLTGRVIAFEPVPSTFALLSANVRLFDYENVTLINAAVSDKTSLVGMSIPKFSTGLTNYYQAHISTVADSSLNVLTVSGDSLTISQRISLIKIDAEGHEASVLRGFEQILIRSQPVLIVEGESNEVSNNLSRFGYKSKKLPNSPNIIYQAKD